MSNCIHPPVRAFRKTCYKPNSPLPRCNPLLILREHRPCNRSSLALIVSDMLTATRVAMHCFCQLSRSCPLKHSQKYKFPFPINRNSHSPCVIALDLFPGLSGGLGSDITITKFELSPVDCSHTPGMPQPPCRAMPLSLSLACSEPIH